jgi:hypothetical protein
MFGYRFSNVPPDYIIAMVAADTRVIHTRLWFGKYGFPADSPAQSLAVIRR